MPEQNDILNDPVIRDAIGLIGPLPALAGGTWPGSSAPLPPTVVQPRAVAAEVIGFDFDLDKADRSAVIDALTRAFPVTIDATTKKPVLKQSAPREQLSMYTAAQPFVGNMHVAAVALQTLASHAERLDDIK